VITGTVTRAGEAVIRLTVHGPSGRTDKVRAVIDTGYDGWLTLPPDVIARLQFPWSRRGLAVLADGSEIEYDVYEAVIVWDRGRRLIEIDESDSDPLVGMAMLAGYELNVQVRPRGKVTIKRLGGGQSTAGRRR
jgi:clan AA aspartic protease